MLSVAASRLIMNVKINQLISQLRIFWFGMSLWKWKNTTNTKMKHRDQINFVYCQWQIKKRNFQRKRNFRRKSTGVCRNRWNLSNNKTVTTNSGKIISCYKTHTRQTSSEYIPVSRSGGSNLCRTTEWTDSNRSRETIGGCRTWCCKSAEAALQHHSTVTTEYHHLFAPIMTLKNKHGQWEHNRAGQQG